MRVLRKDPNTRSDGRRTRFIVRDGNIGRQLSASDPTIFGPGSDYLNLLGSVPNSDPVPVHRKFLDPDSDPNSNLTLNTFNAIF